MRQNIYDDEAFFQGHAELRASPGNFNDLVEQPALRALLPPLAGASVLDMGCGAGVADAFPELLNRQERQAVFCYARCDTVTDL